MDLFLRGHRRIHMFCVERLVNPPESQHLEGNVKVGLITNITRMCSRYCTTFSMVQNYQLTI